MRRFLLRYFPRCQFNRSQKYGFSISSFRNRMALPKRKRQPIGKILHETATNLKKLQLEEPKAALLVEEWGKNRQKTIDLIPIVRERVETIRSRCNYGRHVGAAVSVGARLTTNVGMILTGTGNSFLIGDQVLEGGLCLKVTGPVVSVISNVAEVCWTRGPTNQINEVIQKDIEMTEKIRNWIKFSHGVEHGFGRLLQGDIASPKLVKIMEVLDHCIELMNEGTYEIDNLIQDICYGKGRGIGNISIEDVGDEVIGCLLRIQNNPNIRKPLKEICEIAHENPNIFLFVNLCKVLHLKARIFTPSLPLDFKRSDESFTAFGTIKMVYDLVKNFKFEEIEKRKIAYFKALDDVTEALKSERMEVLRMEILLKLYELVRATSRHSSLKKIK